MVKGGLKQGKLWKRVIGYLIDSIIVGFLVLTPFSIGVDKKFGGTEFFSSLSQGFNLEVFLFSLAVTFLVLVYWVFLEWQFSQTIGKMLFGLYTYNEKKKALTFRQALIRNLVKISSILLVLDTVYLLVKKNGQRWTEVWAKTRVFEGKK